MLAAMRQSKQRSPLLQLRCRVSLQVKTQACTCYTAADTTSTALCGGIPWEVAVRVLARLSVALLEQACIVQVQRPAYGGT